MNIGKIRLFASTALTWIAVKIAPREVRPIFGAFCEMLDGFPAELATGRTYGVVTGCWNLSFDKLGREKAEFMQQRAHLALVFARLEMTNASESESK